MTKLKINQDPARKGFFTSQFQHFLKRIIFVLLYILQAYWNSNRLYDQSSAVALFESPIIERSIHLIIFILLFFSKNKISFYYNAKEYLILVVHVKFSRICKR
jgi:hypothetical protein